MKADRKMMVYRYETRRGTGLYNSAIELHMSLHDSVNCPMPRDDYRLVQELHEKNLGPIGTLYHRYGFSCKAQLKKWMQCPIIKSDVAEKFLLAMYEVPVSSVAIGNTQVVYDKTEAVLVKYVTIPKEVRRVLRFLDSV